MVYGSFINAGPKVCANCFRPDCPSPMFMKPSFQYFCPGMTVVTVGNTPPVAPPPLYPDCPVCLNFETTFGCGPLTCLAPMTRGTPYPITTPSGVGIPSVPQKMVSANTLNTVVDPMILQLISSLTPNNQNTQNDMAKRLFKDGERVVLCVDEGESQYYGPAGPINPYWPDMNNGKKIEGSAGLMEPIIGKITGLVDSSYYVKWPKGENPYHNGKDLMKYEDWENKFVKIAAFKFDPSHMEKVILTDGKKRSIISVLKQHQYRDKLFNDWGLGEVMEYGRGMTMLFHGPPGTGKTWTAHCMAKSLSKKITIVETSQLQTSEPGGFERELKRVFEEATKKGQVLVLDECDSLVMSRAGMGMILGSEINCLLSEIEKYEGVCILTTNRINELDPALERRISLTLEFPEPTEEQRLAIWHKFLPKKLPLGKDVDVKELAAYELTGGLIKNVVLNAARFAVGDDKEEVTMDYFKRALKHVAKAKAAFEEPSTVATLTAYAKSHNGDKVKGE